MRRLGSLAIGAVLVAASTAGAQPEPEPATGSEPAPDAEPPPKSGSAPETTPEAEPEPGLAMPELELHGFVSQGAFKSTANDFIGSSKRGSLAFFEVGFNVSTSITDRLRAGAQAFARKVGDFDDPLHVDWAFVDYAWRPELGLRAGTIKMPFGLYNEYVDVDAARLPILLPPSVYPLRNRGVLISHTGAALYGAPSLGGAGELEYQVWLGTLTIPRNALEIGGATLDSIDTRYVTGVQIAWQPPVDGLRLGATYLRASVDFHLTLSPENIQLLIDAGVVPPDYDGALLIAQRPTDFPIASIEYLRGPWTFAAEYGRTRRRQVTSLPAVLPPVEDDEERFYGLAAYRLSDRVEIGGYFAVTHLDADDRGGHGERFAEPFHAFARDLAVTARYDVNDHWLWKLEGHLVDGTAELSGPRRMGSERYWGLALVKTTVTF